jgi:peptide/nickel transport system substrate-binding protein
MSDEPQYGGTITWFTASQQPWLPQSWDNDTLYWLQAVYTEPYLDTLLEQDMLARGPRGTNEFDYSGGYVPEDYLKGNLAESYTVTPEEITFKIRRGIMWHESPIMESRELTADDIAYSLNRRLEAFRLANPLRVEFIDEFTAPDRYTLVCKTNRYDADWTFAFAYSRFNVIQPPELNAPGVDPADWRSHVDIGTGAFLLQDYVEAAYASYDRNPIWWKSPQIIDGKEYDTPFVDTVVVPFIADWSTFVSALRTGQIDWMSDLHVRYEETLRDAHPDIQIKKVPRILTLVLTLRFDTPPLDDAKVRRALMIATDIQAVVDAVYGGGLMQRCCLTITRSWQGRCWRMLATPMALSLIVYTTLEWELPPMQ